LVSCKVDRSELGYINALANELRSYADFKAKTINAVEDINDRLGNLIMTTSSHETSIQRLDRDVLTINSDIRKLAPKTETRALAKELEARAAEIAQCARKTQLDEVSAMPTAFL
jgi:Na+/phosphate symporter